LLIGAGLNVVPARFALIDAYVNYGNFMALVCSSVDVLNALTEFTYVI